MLLLYRSSRVRDEDLYSYYQRILYWNGFNFQLNPSTSFRKLWAKEIAYLNSHQTNDISALEYLFKRHIIHIHERGFIDSRFAKRGIYYICPSCWEASNHLRFYWGDDGYRHCHLHDIPLRRVNNFSFGLTSREIKRYEKLKGDNDEYLMSFIDSFEKLKQVNCSFSHLYSEEQAKSKIEISIINALTVIFEGSSIDLLTSQAINFVRVGKSIGLGVEAKLNHLFEQMSQNPPIQDFLKLTAALIILDKGKTNEIGLSLNRNVEFYLWARNFVLYSNHLNTLKKIYFNLNDQYFSSETKPGFTRNKLKVEEYFFQFWNLEKSKRVRISKIVYRLVLKAVFPSRNKIYKYEKPLLEEISDKYIDAKISFNFHMI